MAMRWKADVSHFPNSIDFFMHVHTLRERAHHTWSPEQPANKQTIKHQCIQHVQVFQIQYCSSSVWGFLAGVSTNPAPMRSESCRDTVAAATTANNILLLFPRKTKREVCANYKQLPQFDVWTIAKRSWRSTCMQQGCTGPTWSTILALVKQTVRVTTEQWYCRTVLRTRRSEVHCVETDSQGPGSVFSSYPHSSITASSLRAGLLSMSTEQERWAYEPTAQRPQHSQRCQYWPGPNPICFKRHGWHWHPDCLVCAQWLPRDSRDHWLYMYSNQQPPQCLHIYITESNCYCYIYHSIHRTPMDGPW